MDTKTDLIKINDYSISVRFNMPDSFSHVLIIANGAGGNMDSAFIKHYSNSIAKHGIMTVNFNFHYQEIGRKFPDKNEKCQETYLGLYKHIMTEFAASNIVLGGKSMGGRIATQIAGVLSCKKIVVLGYPLHPPGKPQKLRDEHLYPLEQKVLFVQGENDAFGTKSEMERVILKMKTAQAHYVSSANHSLKAPKKSGLDNDVLEKNIFETIVTFITKT